MKRYKKLLPAIFAIMLCACSQQKYESSRTPEASIGTFDMLNGFKAEVFAAEPQVMDPVELTFDEEGNAYVIEMGDYPYKAVRGDGKGRIRKLTDRDGDGRIDTAVVFAEKLESGTSILPWEGGLLVTAAPEILFLKDTTGDDRADIREVLFTGFFEDNSEAQITSLRYGIDNWIYANNGGQAGLVTFARHPAAPALQIKGGDFRFRLDRGLFEAESGAGQYGMEMDDLGHRFYTNNSRHISTSPIAARYLKRQQHMNFRSVMNIYAAEPVMYQATPAPWWRAERTKARQQQYDEKKLNRKEYAEGRFTGASGGTIYAGDAYPASFYGSYFVGDVAGNLVHRDVITRGNEGPFFSAARSVEEEKREFIASADSWFRPCNFTLGYDGNLYLIDMYRQHIETPVSIPDSLKEDMDFMRGNQMGRIYRIVSTEARKLPKAVPAMRQQPTSQLITYLSHRNRWWRLNAQRMILERKDRSAIPALRALFTDNKNPITRLHALYTLEGLDALDAGLVQSAMKDVDAGLREHGAILSERFPQLAAQLIHMMNDTSGLVSLQATLSAGQLSGRQVVPAFAMLLEKKYKDPWFMNAILSAGTGSSFELVDELAKHTGFFNTPDSAKLVFVKNISQIIGSRKLDKEVAAQLQFLSSGDEQFRQAGLTGLFNGLKKEADKNVLPETQRVLSAINDDKHIKQLLK
ncbi:PVC-type heme-binding CxxCH protein [Chitinophaga niabensis]|uniref:Putative membrane-bound dehydrogenase domain-containing protein n=1 Tax=Chitinophaga niabensis TaxID=536979 RepID=A0A1N6DJ54_9BACT|nr:PVC-type heme-binding CxxCH protein [Chitinophaga niabensis]SIN70822.1 putative membrane-bound dehydrogenase domain-containing protein [Chitinophaga niabensis]